MPSFCIAIIIIITIAYYVVLHYTELLERRNYILHAFAALGPGAISDIVDSQ